MVVGGTLADSTGVKDELVKKACAVAFKADKSPEKPYILEKIRGSLEAVNIIGFPASWVVTDWFASKPCGETKINLAQFPSLRSVGNDEAALVNEAFLRRFGSVLSNSALKAEVRKAITEGKQIVFTGHSSGAAVAALATFWALEEYLNPNNKNQNYKPPLCVTFGSPLVGNHIFSHATNRENWSRYFIHFVLRFDIVPRILLAPFSSIENMFGTILQHFATRTKHPTLDPIRKEFYSTVMRNAATVTSHAACNLMGSTNLLLETVTNFVDLSPYRPFGTFVFCTGNGQLIVLRNSDAVLQLLFHTAQPSDLSDSEVFGVSNNSILQHQNYEAELQDSLEMQNVVYLDQLERVPLSADGSNSDIATISTALDGLGLNTRARLCLRAAGELQKQKQKNEEKIKKEIKDKAMASMKSLQEYKESCEIHRGYYDAFKVQKDTRDFQANVDRLKLAGVWDEIIEMLKRYELPDDFEGNQEWIRLGTDFRRLVEPLDIANYYRHLKHEDTGPYMIRARPKRYRYTQRWVEHANRMPKEAISESTFWAEVEELCSWTSNNRPFEDVKDRVLQLEQGIKNWTDKREITKDVLLKEPTFVKLWETLPGEHRATSCIAGLITGEK